MPDVRFGKRYSHLRKAFRKGCTTADARDVTCTSEGLGVLPDEARAASDFRGLGEVVSDVGERRRKVTASKFDGADDHNADECSQKPILDGSGAGFISKETQTKAFITSLLRRVRSL
jgi:hypothetical protein